MSDTPATQDGAQAAPEGQQQQTRTYTQEEWDTAQGEIKNLRKEAGGYRTSLRDTETRLAAFQDGLTKEEAAKLKGDLSGLTERLTAAETRALESDVRSLALKKGFVDPSDALTMIRDQIEVKDGEVVNADALLDKLLKEKPYLRGATGTVDAGARGSAKPDGNAWLRSLAGR